MRQNADEMRIHELLSRLGQAAKTSTRLYLVGGATAVLHGWRASTIDVDLTLEPESREVYEAIPALKSALDLNIEFASPAHFVPERSHDSGLVETKKLLELFERASTELVKYPAIDEASLRARLQEWTR